ncbi:hypothetical protein M5K25_007246 [Dendrobium thyrsiflorum]|uniref:Uncharacterized protein n=1 Tax=Dendrobium thyrsiflorum TaxID=117978 RepID=A0ABD0VKC5_DENTH
MSIMRTQESQYIVNLEDERMKKSKSMDSLSSFTGSKSCVCSPTTHPGSFRCRYHRQPSNQSTFSSSTAAAAAQKAEALPPACSSLKEQKTAEGK